MSWSQVTASPSSETLAFFSNIPKLCRRCLDSAVIPVASAVLVLPDVISSWEHKAHLLGVLQERLSGCCKIGLWEIEMMSEMEEGVKKSPSLHPSRGQGRVGEEDW